MNGNSSKQVLLSVLGIAILVVAVVGVSFAFFSYTKTGSVTNTISTGEIYTYLTTANGVNITNAMPTTITSSTTSNSDVAALVFTVKGKNTTTNNITYTVKLVPGTLPAGKDNWFPDNHVGLLLDSTGSGTGAIASFGPTTVATKASSGESIRGASAAANGEENGDGITLGTGTFAAGGNAELTHTYVVNLWIDTSIGNVTISDTDKNATYCALTRTPSGDPDVTADTTTGHGCENNKPIYSTFGYAAKINVVANDVAPAQS